MRKGYRYIVCVVAAFILCYGCSTTRYVSVDDPLYTGVKKMKIESTTGEKVPGYVKSAVKKPLSVPPNNPLYSPYIRTPFPIGLWVYNNMRPTKNTGFKHWFYEKFAREPVLLSDVQPEIRMNVVEQILENYGYFDGNAEYELLHDKKNIKKVRINYYVDVPRPSMYSSITYPPVTDRVTAIIDSMSKTSLVVPGAQYNVDTLSMERERIATVLRNKGYFYFRPDYIEYLADSTLEPYKVAVRMVLNKNIPPAALRPYRVGDVRVFLASATNTGDTVRYGYKGLSVAYQKPNKVRRSVLANSVTLRPGELFTVDEQNETQTNLSKLGIFRYINLNVTPLDSVNNRDTLDVYIQAGLDAPLEAEFEADVTSKSNNFLGPGVIFSVTQKNIFKGGERLSVKLNGSYEWQTGSRQGSGKSSLLNSYEFGINTSLSFPRLFVPRFIHQNRYPARTLFQLGVDLLNRPKYFRMLSASGSAGYDYQTSPYWYHSFTVFKLVYNKLLNTSESFDQTMNDNPALALSFKDQFIPSMGYVLTFDKSFGAEQQNRLFWQTSVTSAGNILDGLMSLFGKKGEKKLFGSQFSQFAKAIEEVKYYRRLWGDNWIASRFLVGIGYAYGNSQVMPYSEQFYIGGANSIRAFTIRSLGPGSYRPPADTKDSFLDQTGDFKLEANVEFRFKILGKLHGAVFLDAGNIWLLKNDPHRPGGQLKWKGFWNEIALGTGFGLRFDISYLVLRADLGIGLHTPYKNPDKPGYYNIASFKDGLGFHLAIGYPF